MQKWEYLQKSVSRHITALSGATAWKSEVNLPQLGKEGWELVSLVPISTTIGSSFSGATTEVLYTFKRPIE
jgi:hypothetical protein